MGKERLRVRYGWMDKRERVYRKVSVYSSKSIDLTERV